MKKATKGALAAVAGGALMLGGGAGTLAYWTNSQNVTGATIQAGKIEMGTPDCTTSVTKPELHGWSFDGVPPLDSFDASDSVVPGDVLTKVCDFTLNLAGTHIGATLGIAGGTITNDGSAVTTLDTELAPTVVFKEGATTRADGYVVTGAGDHTYRATITVTFDGTNATNGSQNLAAALSAVTLTATQTTS